MKAFPLFLTVLIAASFATGFSARAATLASDNFTNSSGTDAGLVSNTQSVGVGVYDTIQDANPPDSGMTVTTLSGFGSGNVLSLTNGTNTYFRAFNAASTLTLNSLAANETLSLAYNVRFDGSFGGADNFSFGFVNFTTPNSIFYANVDLSATGGTPSEFKFRAGSFNMSDGGSSMTTTGASFTEPSTVSATSYTFQLDVTKQSNGDFLFEYFRNGSLTASTTQVSGSVYANSFGGLAIEGIAFRHSQTPGLTTYLDNVSVTTVPEPTTGALLLGGIAAAASMRRRRLA